MFINNHAASVVTAILPGATSKRVIDEVIKDSGFSALTWKARGTLLKDNWMQRFLPPISPVKTVMQLLLPDARVDGIMSEIVDTARLNKQATGAVYCQPCDHVFVGAGYRTWSTLTDLPSARPEHRLSADLSLIVCIADKAQSQRMSRAAIAAGAHGPIIYLADGRGLRDRLGWLRITKQHEKDVLMILAGAADVEQIFESMAAAGELHLPGRGFMYRTNVSKGLFNLPSMMSNRHYAANVQQMIHAIDHLTGHTHWRDSALRDFGAVGKSAGLAFVDAEPAPTEQHCLSAIVSREQSTPFVDLLLDAGARGVNFSFGRFGGNASGSQIAGAQINEEYAVVNCVAEDAPVRRMAHAIEHDAAAKGITDFAVYINPVERIATYTYRPGVTEHREQRAAV